MKWNSDLVKKELGMLIRDSINDSYYFLNLVKLNKLTLKIVNFFIKNVKTFEDLKD